MFCVGLIEKVMATVEESHQDQESNRKKFSNWLQCVNSLKETKTALHDHVLETYKAELISWDSGIRSHIPQFLRCVAEDRIEIRKTEAKRIGYAKREWHCNCVHSDCNHILKKLMSLQQKPGFHIVWKTEICEKFAKNELTVESDDDDKMDNIPTVETSHVWAFLKRLFDLIGFMSRKQDVEVIKYEDIFHGCKQEHVWCIANMFMQRGKNKTNISNTGPGNTDASMFFKMMMNCKLFEIENENYLYREIILCRDRLHHSANNRVPQTEAKTYLNTMISCLERFEDVAKCKIAIQNIEKMLQETILSVSVPDENLKRLRQKAEEALKDKKFALEVDQEIDKTSGISSDDTSGLLAETKEQIDSISESQPVEYLNDKMKSREDYKREKAEYGEHRVKQLVTYQSEHSSSTGQTVKNPIKHLEKMVNLVKSFSSNLDIAEAVTGKLNPVLDKIVEIESEKDEEIKERLEEVYEQERKEYELLEKTVNLSDFDRKSPIPKPHTIYSEVLSELKEFFRAKMKNVSESFQDSEDHKTDKILVHSSEQHTDQSNLTVDTTKSDIILYSRSDQKSDIKRNGHSKRVCCLCDLDGPSCGIFGSCSLPSGEIILADNDNNKLKKLDDNYQVGHWIVLPYSRPQDVCYIGNNEVVVALDKKKLQFVGVRENKMILKKTLDTEYQIRGLTCHGNHLYAISKKCVYLYDTYGTKQRVLYKHQSGNTELEPLLRHIAVSDDGSKIYVTCLHTGLVTIDSSGMHLYTFTDTDLERACGICLHDDGLIWVCDKSSNNLLLISSDGKQKLGMLDNSSTNINNSETLCFDRNKSALISAGNSVNVTVLKLKSNIL